MFNMKHLLIPAMAVCVACATQAADNYTVTVPLSTDYNNNRAHIVNYDSGDTLATSVVENGRVIFKGSVEQPVMARMSVGGRNVSLFVLEPGEIVLDNNMNASGTELNRKLSTVSDSLETIVGNIQGISSQNDSTAFAGRKALEAQYYAVMDNAIRANSDNPIGYYFFVQKMVEDLESLPTILKQYPAFANMVRVRKMTDMLAKMQATGPGNRFTDFTIPQPDGTKASLSDYVGVGKWMLVDFWASWCGPCMREIKVLKDILSEYGPDKLGVVGVAVWDDVENTKAAIKRMQIPWPQILDCQQVPTDIYGVMGIPCILLVDPQGNIVSRGLQGDDLRAAVRAALNPEE